MSRTATDRRQEILDAAVRVIIDIGFTEMTVADVAKLAGVSTGLVHYHFSSKGELIAAALRAASIDDITLRDALATSGGSATRRIERVLVASLPDPDDPDPSWVLWIEAWGETRRSPEIRALMAELDEHERATIIALIREGTAAREFTCRDPDGATVRLTALRDGVAIEHTLFRPDDDPSAMIGYVRQTIRNNLGLTEARYAELTADPTPRER